MVYEHSTETPVPLEENRFSALILAAVGIIMVSISFVQCCFPISLAGLVVSFFAYRRSVECENRLAKNLSIAGMVMAVIQLVIVLLVIVLYILYFALILSALSGGLSRGY